MAIQQDKLGLEVYKILAAREYGYTLSMYDTESNPTTTPLKTKWIYIKPVNFMLQLPDPDNNERPEIYFWKQKGEHDVVVEQLISRIRKACNQFGVGLTVNDFADENVPKQYQKIVTRHNEEQTIEEALRLDEGMMGSSRRSYYILENARLVCIHSKKVNEEKRGARSRNIKEIYVESNGERFRYPTNFLQGAKAMCRHISEGGSWNDNVGKIIRESGNEVRSLRKLAEQCKDAGVLPIFEKATRYAKSIVSEMKKMQGPRGYQRISESYNTLPKFGREVVESRTKAVAGMTGLMESDELLESYKYFAKRDLTEDKLNEDTYKAVLEGVLGVAPAMARKASRAVTKGQVAFSKPMPLVPTQGPGAPQSVQDKVLLLSGELANVVDNELVSVALSEIAAAGSVTPEQAKFVYGVLKSGKMKGQPAAVPELTNLMDWMNQITKNKL